MRSISSTGQHWIDHSKASFMFVQALDICKSEDLSRRKK
jgi:hypothetical protein